MGSHTEYQPVRGALQPARQSDPILRKAVFLCMREELRIMLKQDRLPKFVLACARDFMVSTEPHSDYGADRQDRGVIVNIGSVCRCSRLGLTSCPDCPLPGSFIALPHNASYNATKQAVGGLTKTMAVEHAANGIRCNVSVFIRLRSFPPDSE
jgi:NAD(P)-dependent dehydrogenase (short-subunit alcohol dehydrogenase family)